MVVETDWQARLVKQIKSEGGYARKASSSYAVGVLDLDLILPVYGAMKVEVKLLKGLKYDKPWSRKLEYTEKQKEEAANVLAANGIALGLAVCHYDHMNIDLFVHLMPAVKEDRTLRSTELIAGKYLKWRDVGKTKNALSQHLFNAWATKRR